MLLLSIQGTSGVKSSQWLRDINRGRGHHISDLKALIMPLAGRNSLISRSTFGRRWKCHCSLIVALRSPSIARNYISQLFWISVQQQHCFLHNKHIFAASHCRLALGKRCRRCGNWRGSRAGDESDRTAAAWEQIRSGCLEEKSVPKSSEGKRETLVQSQGNWHSDERARETNAEMEGERDTEKEWEWQVGDWLVK